MLELIAQGKNSDNRWRRPVRESMPFVLGRSTRDWSVGWDEKVSRQHARLNLMRERLWVEKLPDAVNPIFFNGLAQDSFSVAAGEHFVIGQTTFTLANDRVFVTLDAPAPFSQRKFSNEFLQQVRYRDADHRISVLNRLPDIISSSTNETSLHSQMVNLLLTGIRSATSVAICIQRDAQEIDIKHWDRRGTFTGDFQPSAQLIAEAIENGESTLHMWQTSQHQSNYTMDFQNDWAFVCPLSGAASTGWSIYVTGRTRAGNAHQSDSGEADLDGDVKFTELIGATLSNLRRVKQLEQRQTSLRQFFSPVVMEAFVDQDPEQALEPRQCDLSILFCDLRGFSAQSEKMSDQLVVLLDRVSQALGIMTRRVLEFGGVIGDFHGDSAMGFWGWPIEKSDISINACKAAISIRAELARIACQTEHPLKDFRMGLGIATGQAVAGRIGTSDQVKVTAFGPVVNLASRLEGMTSKLGFPILIDGESASQLSDTGDNSTEIHLRFLGKFQPFGLTSTHEIFAVSDQSFDQTLITKYNETWKRFTQHDWQSALENAESLAANDPVSAFLADYIRHQGTTVPPEWNGAIQMLSK